MWAAVSKHKRLCTLSYIYVTREVLKQRNHARNRCSLPIPTMNDRLPYHINLATQTWTPAWALIILTTLNISPMKFHITKAMFLNWCGQRTLLFGFSSHWSRLGYRTGLTHCDADVILASQIVDDWCWHVARSEQENFLGGIAYCRFCRTSLPSTTTDILIWNCEHNWSHDNELYKFTTLMVNNRPTNHRCLENPVFPSTAEESKHVECGPSNRGSSE